LLLVAGLLAGLAVQAHPSFVALLPGFAAFVLLRGRQVFRRPQVYLAGLIFLAAFANVMLYNWQSGVGGVRSVSQEYPGEAFGASVYTENLDAPLRGLLLTISSSVDPVRLPSELEPFVLYVAVLSLVALLDLARRSSILPIFVVLSAMILLPLVHDDFRPLLKARYTMPLVPLVYVAVAVLLARVLTLHAPWPRIVATGTALFMMGGMLTSLLDFQSEMIASDCTNVPQRTFVSELERQLRPGEWILFDQGVLPSAERLGYVTLLELSRKRVGEASLERRGIWRELRERPSFLTAVSDGKVTQVFEKQGLALLPQTVSALHPAARAAGPDGRTPMQGIGLYRVTAEGATLLAHDAEPGCADLLTN